MILRAIEMIPIDSTSTSMTQFILKSGKLAANVLRCVSIRADIAAAAASEFRATRESAARYQIAINQY